MGYTRQAIKGVSWIGSFRIASRAITFIRIAILARLFTPAQFGLFGIVTLVLAFIEIITETGINVFLIQQEKIDNYVNTAWIVSILRGILISLAMIISSPFVASFFHQPQAQYLIILASIIPLIRGFINPSEILFQKDLLFHKEFFFRTTLFFIESLFAVIFAYYTHSVAGLIWATIISAACEVVGSFIFIKPLPQFVFDRTQFKNILHNGKWVTAAGIFDYLFQNGDNIMVGRMLGMTPLGYYDNAYKISILPISEVADVVAKVTFPVYAKIRDDKERLKRALIRTVAAVSLLTIPFGVAFILVPRLFILIILGPQWLPAAGVLQALAVFGVLRSILGTPSALFYAMGKQNYVTITTFISFVILAVTIVPFVHWFGLLGAGYSAITATILSLPAVLYFSLKALK